jgi:hypothetical protein
MPRRPEVLAERFNAKKELEQTAFGINVQRIAIGFEYATLHFINVIWNCCCRFDCGPSSTGASIEMGNNSTEYCLLYSFLILRR